MKILQLSFADVAGGAARASYRLHKGLQRLQQNSQMLVLRKQTRDLSVTRFEGQNHFAARLRRWLRARQIASGFKGYQVNPRGFDFFSDARSRFGHELISCLDGFDIIHLHWVAGFVDYEVFFRTVKQPVVWTLHDMNPFTGGCHYDQNCGRFAERCGDCPLLKSSDAHDLSRIIWQRKKRALQQFPPGRLHLVADSFWLAKVAQRSSLAKELAISTIHYGLDTDDFAPRDKAAARATLGIPEHCKVVLFAAASLNDQRKGLKYLKEALTQLRLQDLLLVSMGNGEVVEDPAFRSIHLGYIANDRLLSLVYSAADVFVIPSLQEAFGLTALEAVACGTPSVGFDVGGIPDIIRPETTGLLAPVGNSAALARAIERILTDTVLRTAISANCRKIALDEFTFAREAQDYLALYQRLAANR